MKNAGICGVVQRKHRQAPLDINAAIYPENLLARDFAVEAIILKRATDITYIPTEPGWLDLSVIMDLYSRRIVGWSFHYKLDTSIINKALAMAKSKHKSNPELLVLGDRCTQFTSDIFQK